MLAINNDIFYQAFFPKSDQPNGYLVKLFKFLKSDSADNQLLLGYFEKVTSNLYKGRKLQFTKAVSQNLQLFIQNLDKQTIGNILKNCVILLNQKQGILFEQRKKIVSKLVSNLVQPKKKYKQTRQVSSMALIQIIGRHKTYSSGQQLLKYILNYCGQLLLVYSQVQQPEICRFLAGVLTKSTQKIYDPELDDKISIFRIPPKHQKLLQGYLPLRLHYCRKLVSAAPSKELTIRQQDGSIVNKINRQILDYLSLVAITLQNQIDQFIIKSQDDLSFAWESMRQHPKNDIVLVQIDKIFLYVASNKGKNKQKLHHNLLQKFKIVDKFCQIFRDQKQQTRLRPHLFQLWCQLIKWVPQQIKNMNKQWEKICKAYQILIPLHSKAAGLNYNRAKVGKLVVDQQQASAQKKQNGNENVYNFDNFEEQKKQNQTVSFQDNIFEKVQPHQTQNNNLNQPKENKQQKIQPQFQQFSEQILQLQAKQVIKDSPFSQFGDFFNNQNKEKQSKTQPVQIKQKLQVKSNTDFSDFDSFL